MKRGIVTISIVVLLISLLSVCAFHGIGFLGVEKTADGVVLGLDLVGGSRITYAPTDGSGNEISATEDQMNAAVAVMRRRLSDMGFTEADVYSSGDSIVVEIPDVSNPEAAVKALGSTAQVQFRDYTGKVWISGSDITGAKFEIQDSGTNGASTNVVALEFSDEGAEKFAEATEFAASQASPNNYLAIYLDDEEISTPTCQTKITGNAVIEMPNSTAEEAAETARLINAGSLPFSLKNTYLETVGASLGEESLSTSLTAGLIGLILVMVFMLAVYRVMGVASCISLTVYTLLFACVISVFHLNLTLPGIAGVILTVGMAVDANVVIFERIKEELRMGKTVRYAIECGYKRAFWAIFDSNITTLIAAAALWFKGTGTIVGFAQMLFAGVILSMLVMLVLTKQLLLAGASLGITNLKAYCVREGGARK